MVSLSIALYGTAIICLMVGVMICALGWNQKGGPLAGLTSIGLAVGFMLTALWLPVLTGVA